MRNISIKMDEPVLLSVIGLSMNYFAYLNLTIAKFLNTIKNLQTGITVIILLASGIRINQLRS